MTEAAARTAQLPAQDCLRVIACPHPFRTERLETAVAAGGTLLDILGAAQPDPILARHAHIYVGDLYIPPENWVRVRPKPGATVTIRVVPQGGDGGKNPLRLILTIAVVALAFAVPALLPSAVASTAIFGTSLTVGQLVGAAVGAVGMLLVNAIAPIKPPKLGSVSDGKADSQALFIEGARNTARLWGMVPVVLGRYRFTPPYGALPYTESSGNNQLVRMLFVWGYGELQITDLKIGDTPLTKFRGVEIEHKYGVDGDTNFKLFSRDTSQTDLSILVKQASGWVSRTSDTEADALSVDVTFPQGLVQFSDTDGKKQKRDVVLEIRYRKVGDTAWKVPFFSGATVPLPDPKSLAAPPAGQSPPDFPYSGWIYDPALSKWVYDASIGGQTWVAESASPVTYSSSVARITLTAKRAAAVRHSFRWPTDERAQYEVSIRRVTADQTSDRIFDKFYWTALRRFKNAPPVKFDKNLAMTALRIMATDQLNGVVDELNGVVQLVCDDWDSASQSWISRATSNPASLFRWVLQGPAIAVPLSDQEIDLPGLEDWHEFCESEGFEYNGVIDYATSVWDILGEIAAAGRASPTQYDGKWSVVVDRLQSAAVQHFTPRNSWGFEAEKAFPELPHAWRIRFNNADEGWHQDERIVYDDGYTAANATRFEQIELPGVTDPDQIWKLGRHHIAAARLRPERWTFNCDIEHLVARRGDLVLLTHDVLLVGLASGRIKSLTTDGGGNVTGATVDEALPMESGKTYGLSIRTTGNIQVTATLVTDPGAQTTISFSPPISAAAGVAAGDLFGFGELGAETVEALILNVERGPDLTARLTTVPYSPAVYNSTSGLLPAFDTGITALEEVPAPVFTSIVTDESALERGAGQTLLVRMIVTAQPVDQEGAELHLQMRPTETGEPYHAAQIVSRTANVLVVGGVRQGEVWDIRAQWRFPNRLPGPWTEQGSVQIVGRSTAPDALENLTISVFGGQALLRWSQPADLDVRFGGKVKFRHTPNLTNVSWASSVSIGQEARAQSLQAALPLKPGTYLARVFDSDGNAGGVTYVGTKQASVLAFAALDSLDEDPDFGGTHANTVALDNVLKLSGAGDFDTIADFDSVADLDYYGGVQSSGVYNFQYGFDLGSVLRTRLTARISATSTNVLDKVDDRAGLIDDWEDFDGAEQAAADAQIWVRHTDDDPAGAAPGWSSWQRLDAAEFEARGFEFQARLMSDDPSYNILVSDLGVDAEEVA